MDLHSLSNQPGAVRRSKTVGRGRSSGHGKTSGRGHKGQMARKGHKHKLGFEGGQMPLLRRLPKRGFKNPARTAYLGVNVGRLERFADGAEVTPETLAGAGLAARIPAGIKILGGGTLSRKLTVKAHAFSASARARIEAAGGTCQTL
jgi:large subunit ribosomal protein L15